MALPNITIVGNLTADPELRYTTSGKGVVNLRVAANERKKDEAGNWIDGESLFIDVNCWRNAEAITSSLSKGSRVLILGTLRPNDYEKDGVKIRAYRVNADHVSQLLLDSKGEVSSTRPIENSPADPWSDSAPTDETPF